MWGHYQLPFSEPKIYFKGSTSRARSPSGLEFQNTFPVKFQEKSLLKKSKPL